MRLAVLLLLQVFGATNCLAYDKHMIREECEAQWGDDFSMQEYCVKQEVEAAEKIDKIYYNNSQGTVEAGILERCKVEWPRTYTMMEYCYTQQHKSYQALQGD